MSDSENQMMETIYGLLRPHLDVPGDYALEPHSDLRALGLDSMESVDLLFSLEEAFSLAIDDDFLTAETFATPRSVLAAVLGAGSIE